MKKNKILGLLAAGILFGFTACNNSSDGTATNDSALNKGDSLGTAGTATSTGDYSAFADSIERNSQAGYYLNPKTGKKLTLKVDRTKGTVTDTESGEPVWRYVDNRNWWVYGLDDEYYWDRMGEAKWIEPDDKLMYKTDDNKWVEYDVVWKTQDENLAKTWKTKSGDVKIKFGKDGDIKVKDKDGKTKYDADDNKIKRDSSK